ncbi:SDHC, cytochrome b subunit of succinate dehydrogenase [Guyanagaster necrorhizus]|uniref:SDHC, cytochrome b subunit of succinate dehydrogenase n=1 Tax=Guyanagaster necrorhizus TaxID=856835 RepID=A0A9P7W332_9AGAR|nr:SDHC, cytochrome b subunit of succinate dehydrogenase [Guyanagaster necrorhizus MCA 3950]KAG7452491.1 SDHC, cytochrome b subunit of succinate dehydrogenase [Guyanagaster necrorhizus MCA 3950]
MMLTRAVGLGPALRQAAFAPRLVRSQVVGRSLIAKRNVQIQSLPSTASVEILNKQRLKRPNSPHATIYQPQLPWITSIANRITGAGLSVLLYGFSLAYLVAPGTFDSTHIIEFVAGLPEVVKFAGKTILAAPFAYHSWNGVRHLVWDSTTKFLSVKGVYNTGYAMLGLTCLSTIVLVFM